MLYKLHDDGEYHLRGESDGNLTRGHLMVDDEGVVRWVSIDELMDMKGVGHHSGASGYGVYESP